MITNSAKLQPLIDEIQKLHKRHEFAKTIGPDYFEPGMMEYLDQSDGIYDSLSPHFTIQFEARGTRYDGRTEQIEQVHVNDGIVIVREKDNPFNSNNFTLFTLNHKNVGNMPAELCNVIAPLYDEGCLVIDSASVSFVEPITKRSRYAKQAVLFVELNGRIIS